MTLQQVAFRSKMSTPSNAATWREFVDGLAHPDVLHVAKASSSDDRSARAANVGVNITLADMLCSRT